MVNFFTPTRSSCTVKPEAELAADGGITVRDGLPSKPGHNNVPVKEESSAATANCSTFACELETTFGYYHFYALTDGADMNAHGRRCGTDINVSDSSLGHNIPVKEESSAAAANCSIFACELGTAIGGMLGTPAWPTPPAKPPTDLPTKLPVVSAA